MTDEIAVTAPVWLWNEGKSSWHFLTVSGEAANHLRFDSIGLRGGFGSIKVDCRIGAVEWRTSIFPSGDDYILPLKAEVRRKAGIVAGKSVTVHLAMALRRD